MHASAVASTATATVHTRVIFVPPPTRPPRPPSSSSSGWTTPPPASPAPPSAFFPYRRQSSDARRPTNNHKSPPPPPPQQARDRRRRTDDDDNNENGKSGNKKWEERKIMKTLRFLLHSAMSGAVAEVFVNLALYPLDTLKVRAQFGIPKPILSYSHHIQSASQPHIQAQTHVQTLLKTVSLARERMSFLLSSQPAAAYSRALRRAFAGVGAGMLASAFDAFVFTFVYESLRLTQRRKNNAVCDFMAGGVASIASAAVDAPFALARDRIRLGLQPGLRAAWGNAGGWGAVYTGAIPGLVRDVPAEGIEFAAFDGLKRIFGCGGLTPGMRLILGAVAGAMMGAVSAPIDLAVTRIVATPKNYRGGVFGTLRKIAREEGVRAAFTALPHRAAREAFSSALFFGIYDGLKEDDDDEEEEEEEERAEEGDKKRIK